MKHHKRKTELTHHILSDSDWYNDWWGYYDEDYHDRFGLPTSYYDDMEYKYLPEGLPKVANIPSVFKKTRIYYASNEPLKNTRAIDMMSDAQLDAYLKNAFTNMGIQDRETIINLIESPDGGFEAAPSDIATVVVTDLPKDSL